MRLETSEWGGKWEDPSVDEQTGKIMWDSSHDKRLGFYSKG